MTEIEKMIVNKAVKARIGINNTNFLRNAHLTFVKETRQKAFMELIRDLDLVDEYLEELNK
jgi:hypothetical protein